MSLAQGRTEVDGNLGDGIDLTSVSVGNGKIIEVTIDGVAHQQYITESLQRDGGILLDSGNYANPILSNTSLNDGIYNKQTGTSYTIQPSDRGKTVKMLNASANTVTIDTNANQGCVDGMVCLLAQDGIGTTTLTAVNGVFINGVSDGSLSFSFSSQYQAVSLEQDGINNWIVRGI